jgi:hypothetical protein
MGTPIVKNAQNHTTIEDADASAIPISSVLSVADLTDLWAQKLQLYPAELPGGSPAALAVEHLCRELAGRGPLDAPNDGRNRNSVVLESSASCDAPDPAYCRRSTSVEPFPIKETPRMEFLRPTGSAADR